MNCKILLFLLLLSSLTISSCVKEGYSECKVELKFIFDYNMEYADAFDPQVGSVDVHVFDSRGIYMFHTRADRAELIGGNRMRIDPNLIFGECRLIVLGGFSEHFRFTDMSDNACVPGVTTLEEVKLALLRESNEVWHEFPHLWFGQATLNYTGTEHVLCPVYLTQDTNKFHIGVVRSSGTRGDGSGQPAYSFDITAPDGGAYGYDNNPVTSETIVYRPFLLTSDNGSEHSLPEGKINTMRLLADHPGYKLIVRDLTTSRELWNYDLITLLEKTKPLYRPDGSWLPLQEYLDRQAEWNIVILTRGDGTPEEGFTAIGVRVNGWTLWLNDIEV